MAAADSNNPFMQNALFGIILVNKITFACIGWQQGLTAWFKSDEASSLWPNSVSTGVSASVSGTASVITATGNGATQPVKHLVGNSQTQVTFTGALLEGKWTICALTRYTSTPTSADGTFSLVNGGRRRVHSGNGECRGTSSSDAGQSNVDYTSKWYCS